MSTLLFLIGGASSAMGLFSFFVVNDVQMGVLWAILGGVQFCLSKLYEKE